VARERESGGLWFVVQVVWFGLGIWFMRSFEEYHTLVASKWNEPDQQVFAVEDV
jgi:hypothetical protein